MALLPSWAPNLHPLVVHFPIALLTTAVVVDVASVAMPTRRTLGTVATWLYTAGAATAVIAYFSGDRAARSVLVPLDIIPLLHAHADWAFRATWSFVFFASIRLVMSYLRSLTLLLHVGVLLLALAGLGALGFTVNHGSRLVFEQGVGVGTMKAQQRGNCNEIHGDWLARHRFSDWHRAGIGPRSDLKRDLANLRHCKRRMAKLRR